MTAMPKMAPERASRTVTRFGVWCMWFVQWVEMYPFYRLPPQTERKLSFLLQKQENQMTKEYESDKPGIIISPTIEKLDTFTTIGVADALESVFRHRVFEYDDDSREYAEVARAYWILKLN